MELHFVHGETSGNNMEICLPFNCLEPAAKSFANGFGELSLSIKDNKKNCDNKKIPVSPKTNISEVSIQEWLESELS